MIAPTVHFDAPTLDSVEAKAVEWWWPGYLPKGKVVIIEGDPSLGKSQLTIDIAARLSRGAPFPGDRTQHGPTHVVMVTFEDGIEDTMVPRLVAAGARLCNVTALRSVAYDESMPHLWRLPDDIPALQQLVQSRSAGLVVIDTLGSAMASNTAQRKATDPAYEALAHLARMCEDTGCTVLVIRHFTKSAAGNAVSQGGGSMGVIGMARVCLAVHRDPDVEVPASQPELDVHRVLTVVKNNLAPKAISRTFQVMQGANLAPCISWRGTSTRTADGLVEARRIASDPASRSRKDEAEDFLRMALADGPLPMRECEDRAKQEGISTPTLKRAADHLGIRKQKGPGKDGRWFWMMPQGKKTTEEGGGDDGPLGVVGSLGRLAMFPAATPITVTLDNGVTVETTAGDPDLEAMQSRITDIAIHQEAA